ncbi:MAG: DUF2505 domain-containing protein [Ornithinibacter sp.]
MRLTTREELAGTPEEVYALLSDQAFQEAKCEATTVGGPHSTQIGGSRAGARVTTQRELPTDDLPDVARSFVGDKLTIIEILDWAGPAADGSREAVIDLHVKGAPLTLKGRVRLERSGAGTIESLDAELKANVPFISGRIEQAAAGPIRTAIDIEIALLREWLAR